jgi:class 3 adenylate cyclase
MCHADAAMLSPATEERLQLLEGTAGFPNIQLAEIVRALVWQYMREQGNGCDQPQQDIALVRAFRSICEALANQAGPLGAVHVQGLVQDKESNQKPIGALSAALIFADMQGYTRATAEADRRGTMAELIEMMGRLRQRMYDSLELAGGGRIDCGGDGMFAWIFDPLKALEAAVAIQESLRRDPILFPGSKERVRMRMALHWGDVHVGTASSEKMIIGTAVNLTSRMLQVADLYDNDDPAVAGCVVVSDRLINEIKGREMTDRALPEGTTARWRRRWCQVNREQFAGLVGQTEPISTYIVYPEPFESGQKTTFVEGLACYLQDNWEVAEQRFSALLTEGPRLDPKLVNPCRELLHYMYRVQARTMEAANLMARRGATRHFPELGTLAEERGWRRRGEPSVALRKFLGALALERSNTWHPPASGCHGFRFTPKEYRGHKESSELKTDSPDNIFGFRHPLALAMES